MSRLLQPKRIEDDISKPRPPGTRLWFAQLFGVLTIGLLLRWWNLKQQCLTHDEVFEVEAIRRPFLDFTWSPDGFPPLHRIFLWCATLVTSDELAGRWLAVACGLGTIAALYGATQVITGASNASRSAGLAVAAWTAVSPLQIYYSQESRAYGLYLLFASCALWSFAHLYRTDCWRAWCAFIPSCILGELTHYYFVLLIAGFGVVWCLERRKSRRFRRGIIAGCGLGVYQLVLWPLVWHDLSETIAYPEQTPFGLEAVGYTLYSFVAGYSLGPAQSVLHELPKREAILGFMPFMLLIVLTVAGPAYYGISQLRRIGWAIPLLLVALLPIALAGICSRLFHLNYNVRYVVVCSLPFLVAGGIGWSAIPQAWLKNASAIGICLVSALALFNRYYVLDYQNEDIRGVANYLEEHGAVEDEHVFVISGYMTRPLRYYLPDARHVEEFPEPNNPNGQFETAEDVSQHLARIQIGDERRAWLVLSRSFHGDPHRHLRNALVGQAKIRRVAEFSGAELYRVNR